MAIRLDAIPSCPESELGRKSDRALAGPTRAYCHPDQVSNAKESKDLGHPSHQRPVESLSEPLFRRRLAALYHTDDV